LDRAMYQSSLRRARPLVARSSLGSQRRFGILPIMRQPAPGRPSTDRPAPPHEAADARGASAAAPSSALTVTKVKGRRRRPLDFLGFDYLSLNPFSNSCSSLSHKSGMLAEPSRRMSSSAPRTSAERKSTPI